MDKKFIHEMTEEEKIQGLSQNITIIAVAASMGEASLMKVRRKDNGKIKYLLVVNAGERGDRMQATLVAEMMDENPADVYQMATVDGEFRDMPNPSRDHTAGDTIEELAQAQARKLIERQVGDLGVNP